MKNLKKLSRIQLKSLSGGYIEDNENSACYGLSFGSAQCTCISTGGVWVCGKCITDSREKMIALLSNNCDQFNNWPRELPLDK